MTITITIICITMIICTSAICNTAAKIKTSNKFFEEHSEKDE